jgi:uncharacterized protein (DUF362 family)/ferredoxin
MQKSKVAVVRCDSYDEERVYAAVKRGMELLGGAGAFAAAGERILLKPNVLVGAKPEEAVTTHPAVLAAAIRLFSEAGARLSYGDSPGFGKPAEALSKCGLAAAAERFGVPLGEFERGRSVDFPQGSFGTRFDIAQACLEADGIVSLPKMKTHQLTRITGAVKNQFGCVYGLNKARFHVKVPNQENFAKMLVDLNRALPLRLCIMDGIEAMEGNGPRGGSPRAMNCLLLSADPVALDAVFCRMIDLDPEFVPTITYGAKTGLGRYAEAEVEILGDDPGPLRRPDFDVVRKPAASAAGKMGLPHFIGNAVFPRPRIDPEACMKCGVCVSACPVEGKALSFRKGRTEARVYDYRRCIRCYCCQEMCPYKAISVRKPFLGRLLTGA